jgi:PhnB protein
MPQLNVYLNFPGTCAQAVAFYQRVLGAELTAYIRFGDGPPDMPCAPEHKELVMHARLQTPQFVIMAGDCPPGMPYQGMHGFGMAISCDTQDEARQLFAALSEGGQVGMPLAETFWAGVFGMCTDRFGTPWLVNGAMKPLPAPK